MFRPNARSPSITSQESYSAVMIADLVADVPVNPETEQGSARSTKEATNLAYDGHMDGETTNPTLDKTRKNSAGISRGVILNAVQFGQNDSNGKSDEKTIQLTATLPVPTLTQQIPDPKGFKDMSVSRKVAFVFSFLPSILFVLSFAVILPCNVPKPCVEEVWLAKFNDTEPTSGLEIPNNVMFTAIKKGENVLMELDKSNGKLKEIKLAATSTYLKCGNIMHEDQVDCIVMDETGKIFFFNNSQSKILWNPVSEAEEKASIPVFLSGCNSTMEDVAVAVSNTRIKVLYSGNRVSNFTISDCDSVPIKLMPWAINGSSDIVFICEKDGEDRLIRVPKNVWCAFTKNPQEKPLVLQKGSLDSLKKSVIHPLEDGLVLWSGDEAFMIQPNGTELWKVSNLSHPEENRFILHGKFQGENQQVAFFSSSLSYELKITLLDPSDGSFVQSTSYSNSEATQVTRVQGNKRDFAVILLKKISEDIVTTALTQINDISTKILNLITNEEVNDGIQRPASEEVALLDLEGNIDTVKVITDLIDGTYNSTMTAVSDKKTGILSIYVLSTTQNSEKKTTEARNINVANWDKSTKSNCKI